MKQAIAKALGILGLLIGAPRFASASKLNQSDAASAAQPLEANKFLNATTSSLLSKQQDQSHIKQMLALEQRLFAGQHVKQLKPEQRDQLNEMIIRSSLAAYGVHLPPANHEDSRRLLAAVPSHVPAVGFLTSGFGRRESPFNGRERFHRGVDIAAPYGSPIFAAADGVVIFAGWNGALGRLLVIHHGFGISTRYAHAASLQVSRGAYVRRGEIIGTVGNSGRSTGAHLHFEVRVGRQPIDPTRFMFDAPNDSDRVLVAANQVRPDDGLLGDTEIIEDADGSDAEADIAIMSATAQISRRQTPIDAQEHARQVGAEMTAEEADWSSAADAGFGIGGESEHDEDEAALYPSVDPSDEAMPLLPVNFGIIGGFSLLALVLAAGDHLPASVFQRRRRR